MIHSHESGPTHFVEANGIRFARPPQQQQQGR
jgi:hypothetical protein